MSGFSIDWLDLREPADFAARDKKLAARVIQWLMADRDIAPVIVDLGAGTGSTLRALTQLGTTKCIWRLVDHDPALLNEALRRHSRDESVEDYEADLRHPEELPLGGITLLSASALFDLVSAQIVDALVERVSQQHCAVYAALNYDGRTQWSPAHALDQAVLEAFNLDQRRDKGLGPALGPQSPAYLETALQSAGYSVHTADSPWLLDGRHAAMVTSLIHGIHDAVCDGYGLDQSALADWKRFRLSHVTDGTCLVGHVDVLALPAQ